MAKYLFDEARDLTPVDQVGYLDLRKALDSGVVSGDFNISDENYNNASPADLMHRPDDVFAGYRQRDYVRSSLAAQSETE